MTTFIALIRGINVGGNQLMPMKKLAEVMTALGCNDVRTYIQSGNVVFKHKSKASNTVETALRKAIDQAFGFAPQVLVIPAKDFAAAAHANPYPQADHDPKSLHLFFLEAAPQAPDLAALKALASATEDFTLRDNVFYLYAPDGVGRSKLAQRAERLLGVAATARNWRTVTTLIEMAESK